jgi:hypothetical protein
MISYISEIGCAVAANVDGTLRVPHFFQVALSLPREPEESARNGDPGIAFIATSATQFNINDISELTADRRVL